MNGTDTLVLTGARVHCPDGTLAGGWLSVSGERISAVGTGTPPAGRHLDLAGAHVVPGFVDVHCHGGGGGSFTSADPDEARTAIETHRRHGTTSLMASLVSAPPNALVDQLAALRELVTDGELVGAHLEGPFIAEARCGAHDPSVLREPDDATVGALLDAGDDIIRMVTLAPELTGAIKTVRRLTESGVIAAIGHTDAVAEQVRAAVDAGATVATHLFNGMRPLHHREPGPVGVLLDDDRVTVELICDLVHVHPDVLRLAARHAGRSRTVLVTDAMSATDVADGRYRLGNLDVQVAGGVATVPDTGSLAGSTLTMDVAFRNLVHDAGLDIADAVAATASHPATQLGIDTETGSLSPGLLADLVVLDDDLRLTGVLRRGSWVVEPLPTA
ncbi:N-acetylglucosamine-6-phosphate deacetylase [Saccharomonospora azurea]|uniref:N-acetylglucosamine-6-phosphate deacetylase n=1 Tax=Saccharomonospora azurea NA-128 TaxID=882081 RepID=H8G9I9_9PSEU|nr:N-acetylglucosamine-6-phosphate deacetylase [Saccharomonospora azurea]EHY89521.1 N-acetylglucosamine-6-phosphate deacetylase [Saccharomonospora azurea NA-128]